MSYKILITQGVAAAALMLGASQAMAANNASADATTTLVAPVEVTKTTNLAFGQLAIPASGATATTAIISTAGAQSGTANTVGAQTTTAAAFDVTGQASLAYTPTITVTDDALLGLALSGMSGKCGTGTDQAITVATATGLTGCALALGVSSVAVGGTLSILGTATAGAKTAGTVAVTVAYN